MPKQLLIETRMNSLSLCEGVQPKTKGCLGTLKGPCADFKNPTRNDNFYSRKLWENVFKDPLVKESLEDRVLIGELDHPGDRLETKATNACIVMTDYDFDDQNGVVNGTFDILDTPNGRILRSLLDYGCKIGVSSRGEGDVTESQGVHNVDEDSYYFVAFDAVCLPAVQKAKPALQESVQKRESLKESLVEQIKSSTTVSELNLIEKVLRATNLPDIDSILESIKNKSKELEGINGSSSLLEDLEKATRKIKDLSEENSSLKLEVTNCKSRLSKIVESRRRQVEKSGKQKSASDEISSKYRDTQFKLAISSKKVDSLTESQKDLSSKINSLQESLRSREDSDRKNISRISSLEESLRRSQSKCSEKDSTISSLREELSRVKSDSAKSVKELESKVGALNKSLEESKSRADKILKSRTSVIKKYVIEASKFFGIDGSQILESVRSNTTIEQVNKMIQEERNRSDRYKKLPVVKDSLIESVGSATVNLPNIRPQNSEEDDQTIKFMENFYGKIN